MNIFYSLKYDHQLEPQDFGFFLSVEKAEDALKTIGVDITDKKEYGSTIVYAGSYYLKEHHAR